MRMVPTPIAVRFRASSVPPPAADDASTGPPPLAALERPVPVEEREEPPVRSGEDRAERSAFPGRPRLGEISAAARAPWKQPLRPSTSSIAADEAALGHLVVRAASVVGPGHRCGEPAQPRQDAYQLGRDRSGRHLLIAVADGVSAAPLADIGAREATRAAVDYLRRALDDGAQPRDVSPDDLFRAVADRLFNSGARRGVDPAHLSTLLCVVVVEAVAGPDGRRQLWAAGIADVTVWLDRGSGFALELGERKRGPDRNTVRSVLPSSPDPVHRRAIFLEPGARVAVVTDGIGDAMDSGGAADWFSRRWAAPPPLGSFLLDVDFEAKGYQDDRTAVVVWCPPAGTP